MILLKILEQLLLIKLHFKKGFVLLLQEFVDVNKHYTEIEDFSLELPDAKDALVNVLQDERCPAWVENISLKGVTLREGSHFKGFSFLWHMNPNCLKITPRGKFSFHDKYLTDVSLKQLTDSKTSKHEFLTVCENCANVNDSVLLFLQATDLFMKVNQVYVLKEKNNFFENYDLELDSVSHLFTLASFEKKLFILKNLLNSESMEVSLPFMFEDIALFENYLGEVLKPFKKQSDLQYKLIGLLSMASIPNRHDLTKFTLTLKGPFPEGAMLFKSIGSKFMYIFSSSIVIETLYRVCLMYSYKQEGDTYYLEAPKGVKLALKCLLADYDQFHDIRKVTLNLNETSQEEPAGSKSFFGKMKEKIK